MFTRSTLFASLLGLFVSAAQAQITEPASAYPSKPIKIIVPWPAGGSVDGISRTLAARLAASLGQQVVVDNRPGASGNIGAGQAAKAAADGYTLLIATTPMAIGHSLQHNLPFDMSRDFAPISLIATVPSVLVVNPAGPSSVKELVAKAKSAPGKVRYASSGPGTQLHLVGEIFKRAAGIDIVHVPYKGGPPALTDIIGGHVEMMFPGVPAVLAHLKARQVKGLAVTSKQRLPLLPDLPTMAEAGFPGVEALDWYGVVAPAGTPKEIVARLHGEIAKALSAPGVHEDLVGRGFAAASSTPEQFGALMDAERKRWAVVVKETGVTVD